MVPNMFQSEYAFGSGEVSPQSNLYKNTFYFLLLLPSTLFSVYLFPISADTSGWTIRLGRQSMYGQNPNEMSTTVAEIILHPKYDASTNENDMVLLRLSSAVSFTNYIRPVCLAASGSIFHQGTDSWVTGWGNIREGGDIS